MTAVPVHCTQQVLPPRVKAHRGAQHGQEGSSQTALLVFSANSLPELHGWLPQLSLQPPLADGQHCGQKR